MQLLYEAILTESKSERDKRNGLTKANISKYIKQNHEEYQDNDDLNLLITSSIDDALKRGTLQKGVNNSRYKITNLGHKEYKMKGKKKYDINKMKVSERENEISKNNEIYTLSKYNEKYFDAKHCKFDDELNVNIIYSMNIEPLKKNLKFRGLKVGGNKDELKSRLKSYINDDKCRNSKTFKELKENIKNMKSEEKIFKYKCEKKLFNTLTKINEKFMNGQIPNDIWQFIAIYGAGIKTECAKCNNEIYVIDSSKTNGDELIEFGGNSYYIYDSRYYDEDKWCRYKLSGRVFCGDCMDSMHYICGDCGGYLHSSDYFYGNDECVKCDAYFCDKCNDKWHNYDVDWCYRAGLACCNSCLADLSDMEKEW